MSELPLTDTRDFDTAVGGTPGTGARHGRASGHHLFAGVLLLASGAMAALQGVAALTEDGMGNDIGTYAYRFSLPAWGWVHLTMGAVAAAAGWGVLRGVGRARDAAIAPAALTLVAQFLFLPYEPLGSLVMIAVDAVVIWALCAHPGHKSHHAFFDG